MLLDRRGGNARPAAAGAIGVIDYAFSPDGRHVALVLAPQEPKRARPLVIEAARFKDDEGYVSVDRTRELFLLDLPRQSIEPLAAGAGLRIDQLAFSPDGHWLAFTRSHETDADLDGRVELALLEPHAGAAPRILYRPFAPNHPHLEFSPDGRYLAFLQGQEPRINAYMQDRLYLQPLNGGTPLALTERLDRAVTSYAFEDAGHLRAVIEDDGAEYPVRIDIDHRRIDRPAPGTPAVASALSSAGGHTAMLRADDRMFPEVFALEGDAPRQITAHNEGWMRNVRPAPVEAVAFRSGREQIHGLLVKPPDFSPGHAYPLLLWIHGGPNGQDEHALALDGYQFEPQLFAGRGWLVLQVNYQGGSGRGLAFATRIAGDWGHREVQDLLAGVDYLVAGGRADANRLAVGGWSYGALLTDYLIARDRRFKAAIVGAGSGNQLATYGSDIFVLQYNAELGPPWEHLDRWLKVSQPFLRADRITTPTLFLGGERDNRVPLIGGEQMYQALKTRGVPTRLVVYPGERHIIDRPSFIVDLAGQMSAWFDAYVK